MFDVAEYSSGSDYFVSISKRKKNKNKRRFSDEQIRSLEVTFESETKLEPRKKAQLAKELGLQPRQVAIWFQNKRARWKSKQIEKDYNVLLASYNNLASQFETMKKEKQSLLIQLQKLKNETAQKPDNECVIHQIIEATGNSSSEGESEYTKMKIDVENKHVAGMLSDDDDDSSLIKAELIMGLEDGQNDHELLKMVDSPLASSEDWGNSRFDSDDLTAENCQWWDFWC